MTNPTNTHNTDPHPPPHTHPIHNTLVQPHCYCGWQGTPTPNATTAHQDPTDHQTHHQP